MPGGGYIFSTSNCVYTGMPLARYELMLDVWRREGNYGGTIVIEDSRRAQPVIPRQVARGWPELHRQVIQGQAASGVIWAAADFGLVEGQALLR